LKTILILEDDLRLGTHWKSLLEAAGHRIIHETDADEAINVIENEQIDLVITDILIRSEDNQIRNRGGFSLLSHIKFHAGVKPKIITVSGGAKQLNLAKHAELFDAAMSLVKPVTDLDFVAAVESVLDS
jgi:DNA-binding response OmpR family regulator